MLELVVLDRVEDRRVFLHHVADMAQPVVGQADAGVVQAGVDAAAAVVADDQDVLHLELVDRVLDHAQAVQVAVRHHVGDVAVHEHLARRHADDLVGGHARIGAADPQVFRVLLLGQVLEELGVFPGDPVGPFAVVLQQPADVFHFGCP